MPAAKDMQFLRESWSLFLQRGVSTCRNPDPTLVVLAESSTHSSSLIAGCADYAVVKVKMVLLSVGLAFVRALSSSSICKVRATVTCSRNIFLCMRTFTDVYNVYSKKRFYRLCTYPSP